MTKHPTMLVFELLVFFCVLENALEFIITKARKNPLRDQINVLPAQRAMCVVPCSGWSSPRL